MKPKIKIKIKISLQPNTTHLKFLTSSFLLPFPSLVIKNRSTRCHFAYMKSYKGNRIMVKQKYFPFDHIHKHDLSSVYKEKVLAFAVGLGMALINNDCIQCLVVMNVCKIKNKKRIDEKSMQNFRISLVINRIFLFWVPKKIDFAFSLLFMPCMGIENQHLKHLPSFPLKCPSSPFLPSTLQ